MISLAFFRSFLHLPRSSIAPVWPPASSLATLSCSPSEARCCGYGTTALIAACALELGGTARCFTLSSSSLSFDDEDPRRGITYVISRQNDIIIGGTAQRGDWDLAPRAADTDGILRRVAELHPSFKNVEILEVKVGLRPGRTAIRLEAEELRHAGRRKLVIHNYGHGEPGPTFFSPEGFAFFLTRVAPAGGSGWTVAWGCVSCFVFFSHAPFTDSGLSCAMEVCQVLHSALTLPASKL